MWSLGDQRHVYFIMPDVTAWVVGAFVISWTSSDGEVEDAAGGMGAHGVAVPEEQPQKWT